MIYKLLSKTMLKPISEIAPYVPFGKSKTISRIVKGETASNLNTAVLICFGMNLPPVISDKLLDVLDCKLKPVNPDHQWISEALHVKYPEPLWAVREYLQQYDVELYNFF